MITFLGTGNRACFEAHDIALAEELARRAALAVDNARLYRTAQEANRAKDEFLANLSHELRTPMTAILGWAHLLQLGDLEPDQIDLGLRTIRQSGEAQAKLIDDLLDVSRIVTGKLHLSTVPVDLAAILQSAVAAIRPAAEAKKQRLEIKLAAGAVTVRGDASRLQQVFWNLLSNAVKFTPPGGVVRLAAAGSGPDVIVTVEDTGDGIAAEFLPLVFERFRQAAIAQRGRTGSASAWRSQRSWLSSTAAPSSPAARDAAGVRLSPFRCRNCPAIAWRRHAPSGPARAMTACARSASGWSKMISRRGHCSRRS